MDIFVSVILPLAIAFMMFSLGVGLTTEDFKRIGRRPRAFLIGATHQVILLPILAYALILVFGFTAETAVGIMILAACPGGVTSNIITRLAKWDVALSVTLTATISLTCVITVPLILDFAMHRFMASSLPDVDISQTAFTVFLLSTMPVLMGLAFRAFAPLTAIAVEPLLAKLAITLFVFVIGAAIVSNWIVIENNILRLGLGLFSLVVLLTTVGFWVSRSLGCAAEQAKTISIETGVQNGSLGIGIAAIVVGQDEGLSLYAVPCALYSVIYLATVLPALLVSRDRTHGQ